MAARSCCCEPNDLIPLPECSAFARRSLESGLAEALAPRLYSSKGAIICE